MAANSSIEWTEMTWNPVTGCTKVSQGCKHCYAERMAMRLQAMGVERYRNGFAVTLHEDLLDVPLLWKKPRLIFVNSMSDLFHEEVPLEFIERVFDMMIRASQHTFQILTKRSRRLQELSRMLPWPTNVWIGVSAEDSKVINRNTTSGRFQRQSDSSPASLSSVLWTTCRWRAFIGSLSEGSPALRRDP